MIILQYILLHFFLILIFVFFCWKIDEDDIRHYWKWAMLPILVFALEEGLRWGRGIDWCGYSNEYERIALGVDTGHEPIFVFVWKLFSCIGLPYWGCIFICSLFYVSSIFFLVKPYKGVCKFLVPMIVLVTALLAENLIRWYMGLSCLYISFGLFLRGKRIQSFGVAVVSVLIHYGLFVFLFLIPLSNIKKTILSPAKVLLFSLLLLLAFNPKLLAQFSFLFDYLLLFSGRFEHYSENAEGWLTGEGQNAGMEMKSWFLQCLSMIQFYIFLFVIYKEKILLYKKKLVPVYNLATIGVLLLSISSGLELLSRITFFFDPFMLICGAYAIVVLLKKKFNLIGSIQIFFCLFYLVRKIVYFCNPEAIPHEELLKYVWNETLDPLSLFQYYNR